MDETIKAPQPFGELVRKRPGMFFGSNDGRGIIDLFSNLIKECNELCCSEHLLFTVSILGENSFQIEINGDIDLSPFLKQITEISEVFENFTTRSLLFVTNKLELLNSDFHCLFIKGNADRNNPSLDIDHLASLTLTLEFDTEIFKNTFVDELALNKALMLIPLLNRKTEIIVKDLRRKYLSQNYHYFPEGVFYLFDQIIYESRLKPALEIKCEGSADNNKYQIAIANSGWHAASSITSFANYVHTTNNGSHVEGIIEGIVLACQRYIKENNLSNFKVNKKNVLKGFTLVCSVKGLAFEYGGSFKEKLLSKEVKQQVKKIVFKWIYDHLKNDIQVRNLILSRFDERRMLPFEC